MSLNNILLPSQLVVDLYQHVLVQSNVAAKPVAAPAAFLGKNKKNILILINIKETAFLPDKELEFLTTVLSACGLDLSDVAIVNWAHLKEKSFTVLSEQLLPKNLLLLDVAPEEMNLPATPFFTVIAHESLQLVAAPSLSQIEKTRQAKSQLWVALKQLFCL